MRADVDLRADPVESAQRGPVAPTILAGDRLVGGLTGPDARGPERGDSLSGNERNHLFLNLGGRAFEDVAAISGLDHPADGRAVAALDYDRDGWLDFAVTNANSPLFALFHNEIAAVAGAAAREHGMLAVRLVGANRTPRPDPKRSNRDGIGAVFELDVGGVTLLRERRAGEGFAAQSSATQQVGIGAAQEVDALRVRWPSGAEQAHEAPIAAFTLVTVYEDASESPDGTGFAFEPYRRPGVRTPETRVAGRRLELGRGVSDGHAAPLRVLVTMATWCEACTAELPQVARLRASFGEDELAVVGVPVDEDDDAAALADYQEKHAPAYRMLAPLDAVGREAVRAAVIEGLMVDALPATIVTDEQDRVLRTLAYVPSVSEVRGWLAERVERAPRADAETADARYRVSVSTRPGRVSLRVEPRRGWHLAIEAPASLELSSAADVEFEPASQQRASAVEHSERALEFAAAYRGGPGDEALARVKFGICADSDDICVIVRSDLEFVLDRAP